MNDVISHLRKLALRARRDDLTDGQLLEHFRARQDEGAFQELVHRHGRMVFGVCRRVLGNHHDAEDAFQATFLVLARKGAALRARELVGNWLYGVAYRTALRAKAMSSRRQKHEQRARQLASPKPPSDDGWQELLPLLDRELNGLPERYRVALILCDLEGVSRRASSTATGRGRRHAVGSANEGTPAVSPTVGSVRVGSFGRPSLGSIAEGGIGSCPDFPGCLYGAGCSARGEGDTDDRGGPGPGINFD